MNAVSSPAGARSARSYRFHVRTCATRARCARSASTIVPLSMSTVRGSGELSARSKSATLTRNTPGRKFVTSCSPIRRGWDSSRSKRRRSTSGTCPTFWSWVRSPSSASGSINTMHGDVSSSSTGAPSNEMLEALTLMRLSISTRGCLAHVRPHASLPPPRVIRRIDVGHPPGADALGLDDRLAPSPIIVMSSSRDDDEASGRHGLGCLHVQLVAEADVERAGDHGEVPIGWVEVWWNVVAVGYLQAVRERHIGHRSIALEGGALGSAWNRSGAGLPPHLLRPHQDGRLGYGGRRIRRLLAKRPWNR